MPGVTADLRSQAGPGYTVLTGTAYQILGKLMFSRVFLSRFKKRFVILYLIRIYACLFGYLHSNTDVSADARGNNQTSVITGCEFLRQVLGTELGSSAKAVCTLDC